MALGDRDVDSEAGGGARVNDAVMEGDDENGQSARRDARSRQFRLYWAGDTRVDQPGGSGPERVLFRTSMLLHAEVSVGTHSNPQVDNRTHASEGQVFPAPSASLLCRGSSTQISHEIHWAR